MDYEEVTPDDYNMCSCVEFLRSQRPCAGSGVELRELLDRRGPESVAVVRVDAVRELLAEEIDPLHQALRQVLGLSDLAEARIILRAALGRDDGAST